MRGAIAAVAVMELLGACSRQGYETCSDPEGNGSFEVPKGWAREGNAGLGHKPVSTALFVGYVAAQDEGIPLGAVLSVTKLYRQRSAPAGGDKAFQDFRKTVLLPTEVLFGQAPTSALPEELRKGLAGGVEDTMLGGCRPTYRREFAHYNRPAYAQAARPASGGCRHPDAGGFYFVLEYRATCELFEKHCEAFQRAKASFKLALPKNG